MEQSSDNLFRVSANTPLVSIPNKVEEWRIPSVSDAYHASSDASLFSSSLPVLPRGKLNFAVSAFAGQPVDDASSILDKLHLDVESNDSRPEGIRSLLPDDENDLLAGILDDFDLSGLPNQVEDLEESEFFGSGGGMEMDFDPLDSLSAGISEVGISNGVGGNGTYQYSSFPNAVGAVAGEHPLGEHPSRTLFVRNINSNVEDSELRSLFEQYGDIRTLYTACKQRGFVMISYYDIRAARTAMRALQNKPLRRRKLDIHFSIPKDNPSDKDVNQGTLVVFNLDPSVSNDDLLQIFGAYGEVKEVRETPHKRHHKFVEFYDVRAAEAALMSLNKSEIAGRRIKLEPSRPGGARRNLLQQLELEQDETRSLQHQVGSPIANSPPGKWAHMGSPVHSPLQTFSQPPGLGSNNRINGNNLPGLASLLPPLSNSMKTAPIGKDQRRGSHGAAFNYSHSFPDQNLTSSPRAISSLDSSTSNTLGIGTLSGPEFLWGSPTPRLEHAKPSAQTPPHIGNPYTFNGQSQGLPYSNRRPSLFGSSHHYNNHHHVGSAPCGVPFERHFGFLPESPETSFVSPLAFGGMSLSRNEGHHFVTHIGGLSRNMLENGSPSLRMISSPKPGPTILGVNPYTGLGASRFEGMTDRGRGRQFENSSNQIDSKKFYQLDLDKIVSGEDVRTTLMIKNIPNKYTSKMLLAAIDENHRGSYDFFYLPIDFKNKCNVGYAFINMVSPSHIIPFYEAFYGKKWEKFNSEKVASLAFARIQGKAALVAHFQNSSLMNEDKRCRPILFHSEGSETGDQNLPEGSLSNNLNIFVRQPDGSYSGDSDEKPEKYS